MSDIEDTGRLAEELSLNIKYRNPVIYCFVKILAGKIKCNGNIVRILTKFPPIDETGTKVSPCVTLSMSGGAGDQDIFMKKELSPLPSDHPYFDLDNPDELYAQNEVWIETSRPLLHMNFWAESDEDRECVYRQAMALIKLAKMHHYAFCTNYDEGVCVSTGQGCDALTVKNKYGIKNRCPYPDLREPSTYFIQEGIEKFMFRGAVYIEDLDGTPPEYRVEHDVDIWLTETMKIPVIPLCKTTIISEEDSHD